MATPSMSTRTAKLVTPRSGLRQLRRYSGDKGPKDLIRVALPELGFWLAHLSTRGPLLTERPTSQGDSQLVRFATLKRAATPPWTLALPLVARSSRSVPRARGIRSLSASQ